MNVSKRTVANDIAKIETKKGVLMSEFLETYLPQVAILITSTAITGFISYFKGKKVSVNAIERKKKIYQPILMN